ncbi:hypothetical protein RRG08_063701 [Elysia crispata]|uniref:Uncharacterized protein n=1 Tax=Elysia crispata TaxID=231223 RepID=A0AAE0ZYD7_9GAST|nr:hypothetical protein RRG08_063701 [Elysia crispata]
MASENLVLDIRGPCRYITGNSFSAHAQCASIKGQNELFHSIDFPVLNVVFLFKPAGTVVVSPAVSTPCQPTLKSASIVKGDKSHDRTFDDNCFHVTQDGCQDGVSDIVVFRGWRARVAVRNQSAVSKHTSLRQER